MTRIANIDNGPKSVNAVGRQEQRGQPQQRRLVSGSRGRPYRKSTELNKVPTEKWLLCTERSEPIESDDGSIEKRALYTALAVSTPKSLSVAT